MAKELNISTGIEEYTLNGKVKIYFNPTDASFAERIYHTFDYLDTKQDEYKRLIEESEEIEQSLAFLRELDADMRQHLFDLFDEDIVTPLIGTANVYSLADGTPIWFNLLTGIIDVIGAGIDAQTKLSKEKIRKYTEKYAVRDHKKKGSK